MPQLILTVDSLLLLLSVIALSAAKPNSNQYSSEDPHNLRSQRSLYGRDQGVGSSASNDEDQGDCQSLVAMCFYKLVLLTAFRTSNITPITLH